MSVFVTTSQHERTNRSLSLFFSRALYLLLAEIGSVDGPVVLARFYKSMHLDYDVE